MKILNDAEQMLFDRPPRMSGAERRGIFELPVAVWSAADEIQPSSSRIGFLVSAGYFRSARRFFWPRISTSGTLLMSPCARDRASGFECARIPCALRGATAHKFLQLAGFRPFDGDAARLLEAELEVMSRSHSGPVQIFWRAVDWLVARRIEIPTSFRLTEAISRAVQQRGRAIAKVIAEAMTE